MAGTLMLVNPRRRKRKASSAGPRRRRSAKQVAATRRLVAANRSRRRSNPIATKHSYRRRRRARASNPIMSNVRRHLTRRRRRSNPIGLNTRGIVGLLKSGAIGAGGALTVDLAMGYLPLPANLLARQQADGSVNWLYYGTKVVFAAALGAFGKRFLGQKAETMAEGAMVVNLYDLFRSLMPAGMKLGYVNPAMVAQRRGVGAYIRNPGMGQYVPGRIPSNVNPSANLQGASATSRARNWHGR